MYVFIYSREYRFYSQKLYIEVQSDFSSFKLAIKGQIIVFAGDTLQYCADVKKIDFFPNRNRKITGPFDVQED